MAQHQLRRWVDSKLACWTAGHRRGPRRLKLDHQAWLLADHHTLEIGEPKLRILVSPTHAFKSLRDERLGSFCYWAPKSNLDKHLGVCHSERHHPTRALAFPTTNLFQRPELQQERFQVHFGFVLLQGDGLHQRRSFHHRRRGCRGRLSPATGVLAKPKPTRTEKDIPMVTATSVRSPSVRSYITLARLRLFFGDTPTGSATCGGWFVCEGRPAAVTASPGPCAGLPACLSSAWNSISGEESTRSAMLLQINCVANTQWTEMLQAASFPGCTLQC